MIRPATTFALAVFCALACTACDRVAAYIAGAARDAAPTDAPSREVPPPSEAGRDDAVSDGPTDMPPDGLAQCLRQFSAVQGADAFNAVIWIARFPRIYAVGHETLPSTEQQLVIASFDDCGKALGSPTTYLPPLSTHSLRGETVAFVDGASLQLCVGASQRLTSSASDAGWVGCFALDGMGNVGGLAWSQPLADAQPPVHIAAGDTLLLAVYRSITRGQLTRAFFDLATGTTLGDYSYNSDAQIAGATRDGPTIAFGYADGVGGSTTRISFGIIDARCTKAPCASNDVNRASSAGAPTAFDANGGVYAWASGFNAVELLVYDDATHTYYPRTVAGVSSIHGLIVGSNQVVGVGADSVPVLIRANLTSGTPTVLRFNSPGAALALHKMSGGRVVIGGSLQSPGLTAALGICTPARCLTTGL